MSKKREFCFPSADGMTQIHAVEWFPKTEDAKPRGIVQLVHGMSEHIGRYDEFAGFLALNGYYVTGHDHLGHGLSVSAPEKHGYFSERGNEDVLADIETLHRRAAAEYPGVPYIMLGHSMGSFLVRQYMEREHKAESGKALPLDGVILSGTGQKEESSLKFGIWMCRMLAARKGWMYVSPFIRKLASGHNNDRTDKRTPADWLSRDTDNVDRYLADPLCGFPFTLNGYCGLFTSILDCQKKENIARIPKNLPILMVSGAADPVGGYVRGVDEAYQAMKNENINFVREIIYPKDRHEVLNELDNGRVYRDILGWLNDRTD